MRIFVEFVKVMIHCRWGGKHKRKKRLKRKNKNLLEALSDKKKRGNAVGVTSSNPSAEPLVR